MLGQATPGEMTSTKASSSINLSNALRKTSPVSAALVWDWFKWYSAFWGSLWTGDKAHR